jgi:hypothetical protein
MPKRKTSVALPIEERLETLNVAAVQLAGDSPDLVMRALGFLTARDLITLARRVTRAVSDRFDIEIDPDDVITKIVLEELS